MPHATQGEEIVTAAVVLRLVPYRESDRIVHLFTEVRGKTSALARGGRRSQRRFGGALQPFVLVEVRLRVRATSELDELTGASPRRAFAALAADPRRLGRAGYLCELVEALTRERDPLPQALALLLEGLELLQRPELDAAALLRAFEVGLLHTIGVWPDYTVCASCGAALPPGDEAAQREEVEGALCLRCGGERLSPEQRQRLVPGPLAEAAARAIAPADALAVGRRTLARVRALAPRPLRSVAFLRQLGAGAPDLEVPLRID